MPFHFKKGESPEKAVRRVCRQRLCKAMNRMDKVRRTNDVHAGRREIKRVRAILRLMRGEMARRDYRKATKVLRRAAGRLSAPREAQVLVDTFKKLAGEPDRFPKIQKRLKRQCRREIRRFEKDDSVSATREELRKWVRQLSTLEIHAGGWETIQPGLEQTFDQGRRGLELAREEPSPENLHEWRRRVKHLWNQLQWLCPCWPPSVFSLTGKLEQLGELLGDEHDRFLLKQFIGKSGKDLAAEATALKRILEPDRKRLRAEALKLGSELYAVNQAALVARIGRHWRAWQG